jgi:hypothetical protein
MFIVLMPYRKFVVLLTVFLSIKQCMCIEANPLVCGDSRCENVNFQWWFILFGFITPIGVVAGVRRQILALPFGPI